MKIQPRNPQARRAAALWIVATFALILVAQAYEVHERGMDYRQPADPDITLCRNIRHYGATWTNTLSGAISDCAASRHFTSFKWIKRKQLIDREAHDDKAARPETSQTPERR